MCLFKKKKLEIKIDMNNIPKHIAFIADGNGRWAKKRGLPRFEGHKVGDAALKKVFDRCCELGVYAVSFYCFSTENFNRPQAEVDYIFNLFRAHADIGQKLVERDVKFNLMGDINMCPEDIQVILRKTIDMTKDCKSHVLNFGFAYGSRHELVDAVNRIIADGIKKVDEQTLANYLYTAGIPDPDLIVRASGEQRLSNFMLFQAAYSEFYFPKTQWPDFDAKIVDECVIAYQQRDRRYGKIK